MYGIIQFEEKNNSWCAWIRVGTKTYIGDGSSSNQAEANLYALLQEKEGITVIGLDT
jgi:hypothetical protein